MTRIKQAALGMGIALATVAFAAGGALAQQKGMSGMGGMSGMAGMAAREGYVCAAGPIAIASIRPSACFIQ